MESIVYYAVGAVVGIAIVWWAVMVRRFNKHLDALIAAEAAKAEERRRKG